MRNTKTPNTMSKINGIKYKDERFNKEDMQKLGCRKENDR